MAKLSTPETLVLRWTEVLRDPTLQDLPYKIELNARAKIEMSPASNLRRRLQARLATELARQLPSGSPLTGCSILTEIGIRVPEVTWASAEFLRAYGTTTPSRSLRKFVSKSHLLPLQKMRSERRFKRI